MSALSASQPELSPTEAHLVDAARQGDGRAFGELYERYGRRIFAYVLGMVRDHNRAEDIVQDVFVSALRRMRSSDQAISFKPWIYEIAKNACIDEFRRVQRSQEVSIEYGSGEELVSTNPSPDTCFEQRQQLDALHGAFRGLSARQHTVIVLRELEGLSYAEIAARTGMTLPMVESTLLRARRRLGQEYDDIASGRRCQQVLTVIEAGGQAAVSALGLREGRRFTRHIAHCQPCARHARTAGITEPKTRLPAVVKKVAGLLPFPLARWPFPWAGHASSGSHASGPLRFARRAARLAHPASSAGVSSATVATVAAIVIVGGGAAVRLLSPGRPAQAHRTPATITARPAAVTRALKATSSRSVSHRVGQTAPVTRSSGRAASARSGTRRTTRGRSVPDIAAPATRSASPAGSSAPRSSSAPSKSSRTPSVPPVATPSPPPVPTPSLPPVHVPPLPPVHIPPLPPAHIPPLPSVHVPSLPSVHTPTPALPSPRLPTGLPLAHKVTAGFAGGGVSPDR